MSFMMEKEQTVVEQLISDEEIAKAAQHFQTLKRWLEHEEVDRKCVENQVGVAERELDWLEVDLLKNKVAAMKSSEYVTEQLILKASNRYRQLQDQQVREKMRQSMPGQCNMGSTLVTRVIITDLKGNPHSRTDLSEVHGQ